MQVCLLYSRLSSLKQLERRSHQAIGIDLGVKSFAVISDGREYPNINKSRRMRKLTKRLKHEQRKFMRKIRHRKEDATKKCKRSNLDKQRLKRNSSDTAGIHHYRRPERQQNGEELFITLFM